MSRWILLLLIPVLVPQAAVAHHHSRTFERCSTTRTTETYIPGYQDEYGYYRKGSIQVDQQELACAPAAPVGYYSHQYQQPQYQYAPQQQQQASQPTVVAVQEQRCEGQLMRMGLGAIGGGFAGRYAVGGKKSNKTVLGTTLGAVAGSLIGRATC